MRDLGVFAYLIKV